MSELLNKLLELAESNMNENEYVQVADILKKVYDSKPKKIITMMNRLYDLPEEIQRLIFKKVYDKVVEEIRDFIQYDSIDIDSIDIEKTFVPYIFRKPNGLNSEQVKLFLVGKYRTERDNCKYEFQQAYKYYNGYRQTYFLNFANAFLHLKKHPTGLYESGFAIEYEYSTDDESDESDD